jgi:serine acetyltransferase
LYFVPTPPSADIYPTAVVHSTDRVNATTHTGTSCYIDQDSTIGQYTILLAQVTLYDHVRIGARCQINSGIVIGADGFGSATWIAPGTVLMNQIATGAGGTVGLGPVVFKDDAERQTVNGHPLDHPAVAAGTAIKLLSHPICWCNAVATSTVGTMSQLFVDLRASLQAALAGTVTAYRKTGR